MIISLNEQEDSICRFMANTRQVIDQQMGVTNKKAASQSDLEIGIAGFGAEMAVAKYFNVYPDFGVNFEHADYDLITKTGHKVDVKCAMKKNHYVYVEGQKTASKDMFYFFVLNQYPNFIVIGWEWSEAIIKAEYYVSENVARACYAYPISNLRKI